MTFGTTGRIWIATDAGLYYVDKKDYRLVEITDKSIPHKRINNISFTGDGSLWVLGGRDIVRLSCEGKVLRTYKAQNQGDGTKYVNMVFSDRRNNTWMTECRGGLLRYDSLTDSFKRCKWPDNCEPYGGVYEDSVHGCFWISTWGRGIVKYVPVGTANDGEVTMQPCTYEDNINKGLVISMQGSGNTLWCSAMDGFYAYDITADGSLIPRTIEGNLPSGKKIYASVSKDKDDNILVSCYSPRSFIIRPKQNAVRRYSVSSFQKDTGMEMVASKMFMDADDYVWLWHLRYGIILFSQKTKEYARLAGFQYIDLSMPVMEKCRTAEGIWTVTSNSLYYLWHEGMQVKMRNVAHLESRPVSLYDDGKGRLWVGTKEGLYVYDISSQVLSSRCIPTGAVNKMKVSADGHHLFFISSPNGLGYVDLKTNEVKQISDLAFSSLDIDKHGKLWASTSFGTVHVFPNIHSEGENVSEIKLPNNDAIISLSFDEIGHLWILTNNYVKEYSSEHYTSRTIYASDPDVNLDYLSFLCPMGKWMSVGGAGGYCLIQSEIRLNEKQASSTPVISSVVIDAKKSLIGKEEHVVTLQHSNINLEVNFTTFDHIHPGSISFAYCLARQGEKADKWTELPAGRATAYFSGLPRGKYTLSVKATDEYGNWGESVEELTIIRLPAWWETWWMAIIYFLIVVLVIAFILQFYFHNQMQKLEIQKLVALAQELSFTQARELTLEQKKEEASAEESSDSKPALSKSNVLFLKKAKEMVEKNIKNLNYTTEQFASDMCMSRMSLYRRLQTVTGQTPTEFMRMIRLHAAAEMLKDKDVPVADVANSVGFATPSYFSKCFKEAFGVLPTEFRKV